MSADRILLLGALAGFTIFLGLPAGRLRDPARGLKAFLSAVATGILLFLFWDVLTAASEPVEAALVSASAERRRANRHRRIRAHEHIRVQSQGQPQTRPGS